MALKVAAVLGVTLAQVVEAGIGGRQAVLITLLMAQAAAVLVVVITTPTEATEAVVSDYWVKALVVQ